MVEINNQVPIVPLGFECRRPSAEINNQIPLPLPPYPYPFTLGPLWGTGLGSHVRPKTWKSMPPPCARTARKARTSRKMAALLGEHDPAPAVACEWQRRRKTPRTPPPKRQHTPPAPGLLVIASSFVLVVRCVRARVRLHTNPNKAPFPCSCHPHLPLPSHSNPTHSTFYTCRR